MTVLEAIEHRSSYRGKFEDVKVPRDDLKKIMEAGLAAPSGCNAQTTSLIGVDDPDVLAKLAKIFNRPKATDNVTAVICVLTQKIVAYKDKCFNVHDYSASIENMLLATVALGYESCWYEGYITDADAVGRQMADILGVPQDYELVCFLPIGVAAEQIRRPDKKPFDERAWFNGFRV